MTRRCRTSDDHDLCCRFYIKYGQTGLQHIDKCLYLYRVHGSNAHILFNDEVRQESASNYLRYAAQNDNPMG